MLVLMIFESVFSALVWWSAGGGGGSDLFGELCNLSPLNTNAYVVEVSIYVYSNPKCSHNGAISSRLAVTLAIINIAGHSSISYHQNNAF